MRRLTSVAASVALIAGLIASDPTLAQRFRGGIGGGYRAGMLRPGFGGARYVRPGFSGVSRMGGYSRWRGGYPGGIYPRYWRNGANFAGYPGWGYPGWYSGWGWYDGGWAPFAAAALVAPLIVAAASQPPYAQMSLGDFCSTPVRTCQLYAAAPIGTGCSCRIVGGRARGSVTP